MDMASPSPPPCFTLQDLKTELHALGHYDIPDHVILAFLSQLQSNMPDDEEEYVKGSFSGFVWQVGGKEDSGKGDHNYVRDPQLGFRTRYRQVLTPCDNQMERVGYDASAVCKFSQRPSSCPCLLENGSSKKQCCVGSSCPNLKKELDGHFKGKKMARDEDLWSEKMETCAAHLRALNMRSCKDDYNFGLPNSENAGVSYHHGGSVDKGVSYHHGGSSPARRSKLAYRMNVGGEIKDDGRRSSMDSSISSRQASMFSLGEGRRASPSSGSPHSSSCKTSSLARKGKIDRVARFSEMQKVWNKDTFLKASTGKRKPQSFYRMFSALHVSSEREFAAARVRSLDRRQNSPFSPFVLTN